MAQLPRDEDTPFSLPRDVPQTMPLDYPQLNGNLDAHETYDEGIDDLVDTEPYRMDDDPVKTTKQLMKRSIGTVERYTVDHDTVRRWIVCRSGHPARIMGSGRALGSGLYISFEDITPDTEAEELDWGTFFRLFEANHLALAYRTKTYGGDRSSFYKFVDRHEISLPTQRGVYD